ncbi:MAG: potassium channel family protein [Actinomycetota bacterium]|nr:potassium channel family protein [Actinomycetota bacterium]
MSEEQTQPQPQGLLSEREKTPIRDRFGVVLLLLIATVFFSIAAPNEPWAWLATSVILAANLRITMLASGVSPKVVWAWTAFAVFHVGVSIFIASTQGRIAGGYLALATLFLTLVTIGTIARRLWRHAEISVITVLGAVCIYVLLGLSFAFAFQAVGDLGAQPFFASQEGGTRSDYMYFSFITIATVGYGDLTPQGGLGRALAVTEGLLGQIYLVTAVAALVGNLGRTPASRQERKEGSSEEDEQRNGR